MTFFKTALLYWVVVVTLDASIGGTSLQEKLNVNNDENQMYQMIKWSHCRTGVPTCPLALMPPFLAQACAQCDFYLEFALPNLVPYSLIR